MEALPPLFAAAIPLPQGDEKMNSHSFGQSTYHFVWCTKYRYEVLAREDIKAICNDCLASASERHGITARETAVGDDHVHMAVDVPHTMAVSDAFRLLKGTSSYVLFRAFPNLRKRYPRGHLWSPGKVFRSVGDATLGVVEDYVRRQKQTRLMDYCN
jgi:putative transposase